MTISEIKQYFQSLSLEAIPTAIETYKKDSRTGVQNICKQYEKKHMQYIEECNRIAIMQTFDCAFSHEGQYILAGVDEAGRGPLAGPVVAAAVILPTNAQIIGLNDSKQIDENKREQLYDMIIKQAISVGIGVVNAEVIDKINILQATFQAMEMAIKELTLIPQIVLVDGDKVIPRLPTTIIQHAVIKGDAKSLSTAAASIIAKVTRDRLMRNYQNDYPQYAFIQNKGYGSASHLQALKEYGPSPIHRKTFIKNLLSDR